MLSLSECKTIIDQSPILIWRADKETLCDYFNARWLEFRGRSMEQEYGHGWSEGVHPDDLDRCLKTYLDSFNKRETFEMEYRLMRFDGVYRWLFDRGSPFYDENGEFAGYIGSCIDVTERIEAQESLKNNLEEEIRVLRGIIPICSYCHEIRDDKGAWEQIDSYISKHSEATFSHSICPKCLVKVRSEAGLNKE